MLPEAVLSFSDDEPLKQTSRHARRAVAAPESQGWMRHRKHPRQLSAATIRQWEVGYETKSDRLGADKLQPAQLEISDSARAVRGEQAMWRAVLTQALMDAASESKKYEARLERDKARRWLLAAGEDFRTVCHYAGLDPSYVHKRVRRALTGGCQWRVVPEAGGRQTNRR